MTSLFDNVDMVKSGKIFRIPTETKFKQSIENAKYIFLKKRIGVHIIF